MPMPDIDSANRRKPLCYDPLRRKFIYFDDIVSRREQIILPSTLSKSNQKKLIIERQIAGPDYTTQAISGPPMNRDDVVKAIRTNQEFGVTTVEAEISYLGGLLEEMRRNLV